VILKKRPDLLIYGVLIIATIVLIGMVACSGETPVYDERLYIKALPLFQQYGFSEQFLSKLPYAPGPLYAPIHSVFSFLTSLQVPAMRFVSFFFLIVTIYVLSKILGKFRYTPSWKWSILLMGLPPIYVISGLALTESYSIAFCTLAVIFGIYGFHREGIPGWAISIIAGACWALALLGRQTYLPAVLALFIVPVRERKLWMKTLLMVVIGILPLSVVISVWGGLVPPLLACTDQGFAWSHLMLALAYTGILIFIFSPRWIFGKKKIYTILVMGGAFILNFINPLIRIMPMRTVALYLLKSKKIVQFYGQIASGIFAGIALLTLYSFLQKLWERRSDKFYSYFILATLGILFVTGKNTAQFSSRYIIMSAPFLVMLAAPYIKFNMGLLFRVTAGAIIGLLSLFAYLFFTP